DLADNADHFIDDADGGQVHVVRVPRRRRRVCGYDNSPVAAMPHSDEARSGQSVQIRQSEEPTQAQRARHGRVGGGVVRRQGASEPAVDGSAVVCVYTKVRIEERRLGYDDVNIAACVFASHDNAGRVVGQSIRKGLNLGGRRVIEAGYADDAYRRILLLVHVQKQLAQFFGIGVVRTAETRAYFGHPHVDTSRDDDAEVAFLDGLIRYAQSMAVRTRLVVAAQRQIQLVITAGQVGLHDGGQLHLIILADVFRQHQDRTVDLLILVKGVHELPIRGVVIQVVGHGGLAGAAVRYGPDLQRRPDHCHRHLVVAVARHGASDDELR